MRLLLHPHHTIISSLPLSRLFVAARLSPSAALFRCRSQPPAMASSDASTACFSDIDGSIERKEEKLWGGRFEESVTDAVERFTESISFDKQLYKHDIMGSKAHAAMLAHQAAVGGELAEGVEVMKAVVLVTAVLSRGIFLGTGASAAGGMGAAAVE